MSENFILQSRLADVAICDDIIEIFKSSHDKKPGQVGRGVDIKVKESTDMAVSTTYAYSHPTFNYYMKQLQNICEQYIKKYPMCNDYAPWTIVENFGIQHYKPKQAYFKWHTERVGYEEKDNKRHLVFMTYLNDVKDQGETEFYHQNLKVQPRKGLTLIWPADWTHTHRGIASPTEDKYIITGWYSYCTK